GVADAEALKSDERPVLDPSRGELCRLVHVVGIGDGRSEKVATLCGIALRFVHQRRVVEHLSAQLTTPQPARVPRIPGRAVAQPNREAGVRGADELAIRIDRTRGLPVDAFGVNVRAREVLDAPLHTDKRWGEERSDRLAAHDDL